MLITTTGVSDVTLAFTISVLKLLAALRRVIIITVVSVIRALGVVTSLVTTLVVARTQPFSVNALSRSRGSRVTLIPKRTISALTTGRNRVTTNSYIGITKRAFEVGLYKDMFEDSYTYNLALVGVRDLRLHEGDLKLIISAS
jgi:hypothetical protein